MHIININQNNGIYGNAGLVETATKQLRRYVSLISWILELRTDVILHVFH